MGTSVVEKEGVRVSNLLLSLLLFFCILNE